MEKAKLPKRICEILDKLLIEYVDKDFICWYIFQSTDYEYLNKDFNEINEFANEKNSLKLAQAILHGYEPEETEEERKERGLKDSIVDYLMKNKNIYSTYEDYEDVADNILALIKK